MSTKVAQNFNRVAKTLETICASLTFRCTVCMIVYAAVLIGLFSFVGMLVDKKLNEAFPTIDTLTEHDEALANDRFNELEQALPDNCDLLVFSGLGEKLFSTSAAASAMVTSADLPIIASSETDRQFYEVLEWESESGEKLYEILLCIADGNSHAKIVRESCVCTEDGTIIRGNLFPGRLSLSQRELSLVRGMYDAQRTIQKHEYKTAMGELRTLVIVAPVIGESAYNSIVAQAGRIWLFAIPFALAATLVAVTILARMVRRTARPLDQAIDARRRSHKSISLQKPLPIELRSTYDNFIGLMDQLDSMSEDKQRIITDVSHDLKTPLTVISGYTQAFMDGCVPDSKRDEYVRSMHERAVAATQLIDKLVTYAKSEHPSFTASPAPCDLFEQMRLLLVRWQPDIENAGDYLEVDIPDDTLVVSLDWSLMERAIDNLIGNACKHNPPGTTIRVTCMKIGSHAVISIADTGKGIPDDLRLTAFDPFVTSNAARSSDKGTGLGLAIASSFVRLNGGTVGFSETVPHPYRTKAVIKLPLEKG